MKVYKVGLDPQRRPLVLLADMAEKRLLPIWIGPFEAHAVSTHLQGKDFPRPLTHDLLLNVLETLGQRLREVQVTRLEDHTFYALLILDGPQGTLEIDARPSDAIALAVRAEAQIYVAEAVLAQAQVLTDEGEAEEVSQLRDLLRGLEGMGSSGDEPEPAE